MKIAQLFGVKTNPSRQLRCCHQRSDGTECKANPRKGSQYCFFHDPAVEEKRAAARRAGGVIRGRNAQANAQAIPVLAAYLLAKPLRESSGVAEFLNEAASQFCQGKIDSRDANVLRHFALAVLRTLEFDARTERKANREAVRPAKKQRIESVSFVVRDIVTGEVYDPHKNTTEASTPKPFSPLGQSDPKPDTKQDQPDQGGQDGLTPESAASAQNQTEVQQPAKASQRNKQNEPPSNGHDVMNPASPSAQPISSPPQENQPVYPPGLGPRYLAVATPCMPWWRKQGINQGFVTGTVPRTATRPAPATRFRGTRR
jgi:hypothetical protein